jgi:hypothetical protein
MMVVAQYYIFSDNTGLTAAARTDVSITNALVLWQ